MSFKKEKQLTDLQIANNALIDGSYQQAITLYLNVAEKQPLLKSIIAVNIDICLKRLNDSNKNYLTEIFELEENENQPTNVSQDDSSEENSDIDKHIASYRDAFDINFYHKRYPDIEQAGVDAFEHYTTWGWREGRVPNEWFDPLYYLDTYADVKLSAVEPLLHYVEVGQYQSRKTKEISLSSVSENTKKLIPKITFDSVSEDYVPYQDNLPVDTTVKTLAFYLPQFHPFPENDAWWGKGFTEWTNVTKAKPNFDGHYQPHFPIHNGYYDLRLPEVMIEQAKLARNYGVHGFNFYYYWFDGKVLMHKPFEILLKHKEIDINFCITWANENWTRRWDGAENDILIGQNHCEEDSIKFIEHMYQYFNDERYIRVDNKPVLIIYRSNIIPEMAETVKLWRQKVVEAGFDGIYLIGAQTFGFKDPGEYGFDAAMEFPPHTVKSDKINEHFNIINSDFEGNIYSYSDVVKNVCLEKESNFKKLRTAMLSWDNTARKQNNSHTFANFSMLKYKQWLSHIVNKTHNSTKLKDNEKFVFINAWNEWAEGTHLEPDRQRGYAYLQTTYDVLKHYNLQHRTVLESKTYQRSNKYAVILHIHYTDVWDEIKNYLKNLDDYGFDLYVTLTNTDAEIVEKIIKTYPDASITLVENRGRDIKPFIDVYKKIKDLGYYAICKIHSKKSIYRTDGDEIRNEIFDSLLGGKKEINNILTLLNDKDQKIGIITLAKYLISHCDKNMTYDRDLVHSLAKIIDVEFNYSVFPAGSMFWFNPQSFSRLEKIEEFYFEPEEGLADGTLAHAIERILVILVNSNGFKSFAI